MTILYTKFVELTAGLVNQSTLIWNGRRMNAPDTPAIEVRDKTTNATNGGRKTQVFTPDMGNSTYRFCMTEDHSTTCTDNAAVTYFIIAQKNKF